MTADDGDRLMHRIEITGELDPHAAEALRLEIRRLAKLYDVAIAEFRVEQEGARA